MQNLNTHSARRPVAASGTDNVSPVVPPRIVGRYALFDKIASGGMGTVHLGRLLGSAGFERIVAMKRMHASLTSDPEFAAMFCDEIRILSRIRHPNVVAAQDVVEDGDELLLVMEYVHGLPLSLVSRLALERGVPIPVDICIAIASATLDGLHAAHSATTTLGVPLEIVHRDVSPQNVLIGCDGLARILDFGVAKATSSVSVTRIGHVKGKLGYVAPEQLLGHALDARCDIYGVAVVLWELLAQARLFNANNDSGKIADVLAGKIPALGPLLTQPIPRELEPLIRRGLSTKPDDRFASAREMSAALRSTAACASPERVAEWLNEVGEHELAVRTAQLVHAENCPLSTTPSATWLVDDRDSFSDLTIRDLHFGQDNLSESAAPRARQLSLTSIAPIAHPESFAEASFAPAPRPRRWVRGSLLLAGVAACAIALLALLPRWGLGEIAHATSAPASSTLPSRLEAKPVRDAEPVREGPTAPAPLPPPVSSSTKSLVETTPRTLPELARTPHAAPITKPTRVAPERSPKTLPPAKAATRRPTARDAASSPATPRKNTFSVLDGF